MTAAHVHAYELPAPDQDAVLPAADMQAVEHGQVIPLTRNGRPVAVIQPVDPDQAWYWDPEWQEGEREASRQQAEPEVFTDEEFLVYLRDRRHESA